MKELFAVDVTNGRSESENFVIRKLSEELMKKQIQFTETVKEYETRVKEPSFLVIVRYLSLMIGLFLLIVFFASLTKESDLKMAFTKGLIIFIFGIIFTTVGIMLLIMQRVREKRAVKDEKYLNTIKSGEALYDECIKDLKIPQTAKECDIFLSVYENKKGELKPASKALDYVNTTVQLFSSGEYLMIGDLTTIFGIKKSDFKGYEVVSKPVTFNCWNKNLSISDKEMKKYAIKVTAVGFFSVKNCLKVMLNANGKDYYIIIPPYDGENFLKTAGIKRNV